MKSSRTWSNNRRINEKNLNLCALTYCRNVVLVYVEADPFFFFFLIFERIFNDTPPVLNGRPGWRKNRYSLVSREILVAITANALSYYVSLDETRATQIRTYVHPLSPVQHNFFPRWNLFRSVIRCYKRSKNRISWKGMIGSKGCHVKIF